MLNHSDFCERFVILPICLRLIQLVFIPKSKYFFQFFDWIDQVLSGDRGYFHSFSIQKYAGKNQNNLDFFWKEQNTPDRMFHSEGVVLPMQSLALPLSKHH